MAFCVKCGAKLNESIKFCTECGATQDTPIPAPPVTEVHAAPSPPIMAAPAASYSHSEVMSVGSYVGSMILFSIPVIGWLVCILWACGATKNQNRRNFSKALLILMAIMLVVSIVLYFIAMAASNMMLQYLNEASGGTFSNYGSLNELLSQIMNQ